MADEYYAWTNIRIPSSDPDESNVRRLDNVVKPGDKITPDDLGLSGEDDPDWLAYVDSNAVRTVPYPDMGSWSGSPVEYAKARLAAAAEGQNWEDFQYGTATVPTDEEVKAIELGDNKAPEASQATPTPQVEQETQKTGSKPQQGQSSNK